MYSPRSGPFWISRKRRQRQEEIRSLGAAARYLLWKQTGGKPSTIRLIDYERCLEEMMPGIIETLEATSNMRTQIHG